MKAIGIMRILCFISVFIAVVAESAQMEERRRLFFSENMNISCSYNNKKMCCPLVHPEQFKNSYPRDTSTKTFIVQERCTLRKEYFPSPYETKHLEMAKSWLTLDEDESRKRVIAALIDDIPHVIRWLNRVKLHMSDMNVYDFSSASSLNKDQDASSMLHPDDKQYMSYFKFSRTCGNKVHSWLEFIEPITIHARHPLSLSACLIAGEYKQKLLELHPEKAAAFGELIDIDYILLKPGNRLMDGLYVNNVHSSVQTNHFFFDAGAGEFPTGMAYFLCAYQGRQIVFDRAFGWECKGIEHISYWKDIPPSVVPIYSFFNTYASAQPTEAHSVVRIMKTVAKEHDFVSFKLDIDAPNVEIPIAQQMLSDPHLASLVDEFFFELHFRCEIMRFCGWDRNTPSEMFGLKLDRFHALDFFQQFRHKGIRAHIWP